MSVVLARGEARPIGPRATELAVQDFAAPSREVAAAPRVADLVDERALDSQRGRLYAAAAPMLIGLYDPYLAALGGGEKYFLTILEEATRIPGAEVLLLSPDPPDAAAWRRLGIDVPPGAYTWVRADDAVVTERSRELDLLVAMSNDVPPLNHARRAVAMVQFPTRPRDSRRERALALALGAIGRRRAPAALQSYGTFICNSRFTSTYLARRLGIADAVVIPPPVDERTAPPPAKQASIAAVGRFFTGRHNKRHDVLIRAFASLHGRLGGDSEWKLHLVGGAASDLRTQAHLDDLRRLAAELPVSFHVNAPAEERDAVLARSALFWHATGFGEREERHPERLEHFGIATVEAMAHGAVPLVVPAGGQREIVVDGETGRHWTLTEELVSRSAELIADDAGRERMSAAAHEASRRFAKPRFLAAVREHVLTP
jgi:glycosyltransferase involved in cell wall biosynthesis